MVASRRYRSTNQLSEDTRTCANQNQTDLRRGSRSEIAMLAWDQTVVQIPLRFGSHCAYVVKCSALLHSSRVKSGHHSAKRPCRGAKRGIVGFASSRLRAGRGAPVAGHSHGCRAGGGRPHQQCCPTALRRRASPPNRRPARQLRVMSAERGARSGKRGAWSAEQVVGSRSRKQGEGSRKQLSS